MKKAIEMAIGGDKAQAEDAKMKADAAVTALTSDKASDKDLKNHGKDVIFVWYFFIMSTPPAALGDGYLSILFFIAEILFLGVLAFVILNVVLYWENMSGEKRAYVSLADIFSIKHIKILTLLLAIISVAFLVNSYVYQTYDNNFNITLSWLALYYSIHFAVCYFYIKTEYRRRSP